MKTRLFMVCCAALALGSGCATYDSGGTADDTVVVTGSGDRYYYESYPNNYYAEPITGDNKVDPVVELGRGPAVWRQPSPNGQDWVDPRPDLVWPARR